MPSCVALKLPHLLQACQLPIGTQGDPGIAEEEAVEAMDLDVLYVKLRPVILQNPELIQLILK